MGFGRIFHRDNFKDLITEDQAEAVAKKADELLAENCYLVFGIFTADGNAINFTSEKKHGDTHVAILMGPEEMAALNPIGAPIKKETFRESEVVKSQHDLIRQLQHELSVLRRRDGQEK